MVVNIGGGGWTGPALSLTVAKDRLVGEQMTTYCLQLLIVHQLLIIALM